MNNLTIPLTLIATALITQVLVTTIWYIWNFRHYTLKPSYEQKWRNEVHRSETRYPTRDGEWTTWDTDPTDYEHKWSAWDPEPPSEIPAPPEITDDDFSEERHIITQIIKRLDRIRPELRTDQPPRL